MTPLMPSITPLILSRLTRSASCRINPPAEMIHIGTAQASIKRYQNSTHGFPAPAAPFLAAARQRENIHAVIGSTQTAGFKQQAP